MDLVGKAFGNWTVLGITKGVRAARPRALCRCACGTEKTVVVPSLIRGISKSCGCRKGESTTQKFLKRAQEFVGRKFGHLTVVSIGRKEGKLPRKFECLCECGVTTYGSRKLLESGRKVSCGCRKRMRALTLYQKTLMYKEYSKLSPEERVQRRKLRKLESARRCYYKDIEKTRAKNRAWAVKHSEKIREYQRNNREHLNEASRKRVRTKLKARAYQLYYGALKRAEFRGIEFTITSEWVRQALERGCCQVTGLPFSLEAKRGRSPWGPSLDRTDSKQGYTPENTKVVVWMYNAAKVEFSAADVLHLARALVGSEPS